MDDEIKSSGAQDAPVRKRRKKKKRLASRYYLPLLFLVFGLLLAASLLAYNGVTNYNAVYKPEDTQSYTIVVEPGMSGKAIAEMLQEKGIIGNAGKFRKRAKLLGIAELFQAGEYQLSPSMSTEEIYYALQNARRESVKFTVNEGLFIREVADKLVRDGLIADVRDFYSACEDDYDYWFLPESTQPDPTGTLSAKANRLEGYLFPDSYEVFKDASAHDIIDKMLSQFGKVYGEDFKNRAEKMGMSTAEIVTIASMIENETRVDQEREKVSSVIYNRLRIGMPLQIDATVQYCMGERKARVLYADLETDSVYNTYKVPALPAGPISSPGKASLEAALYPAETDYLYYVLKSADSVEHNFAVNGTEFNAYKQQYLNTLK